MPTSDLYNIVPIVSVISSLNPKSVLDIGCGFGKYGMLMREYLEIWQDRLHPDTWETKIFGIDAFENYRNPIWEFAYNQVYIGDAELILPTLESFDLILIADVIEHFEKDNAVNLVSKCLEKSKVVLISTPREFYAQGDSFGNKHEVHRCLFQVDDLPKDSHVIKIQALSCDIFVASREYIDPNNIYPSRYEDVIYLRQRNSLKHLGLIGAVSAKILKFANSF